VIRSIADKIKIKRTACAGLMLVSLLASWPPSPAQAFEIFGIKFFEKEAKEVAGEAIRYQATLTLHQNNKALEESLKLNSLLISTQEDLPLGTVGLLSRARTDFERLIGTLYENGFYGGVVSITLNDTPLETLKVTDTLKEPVAISINIEAGSLFSFGTITVEAPLAEDKINALLTDNQLVPDAPALSDRVLQSESALLTAVRNAGFPFAEPRPREITADHNTSKLNVLIGIASGASAIFGEAQIEGTRHLKPAFVKKIADLPTGRPYSQEQLERARKQVAKLNAVGSVLATPNPPPTDDNAVPVVFEIGERKQRAIGAEASFASVDGFGSSLFWEHRNLFGRAEKLRLEAGVAGVLDIVSNNDAVGNEIDANFSAALSQPGILDAYTQLDTLVFAKQESPEAFTAQSFGVQSILSREISDALKVGAGIRAECIDVEDILVNDTFCPISVPLSADYDVRNDKNEPTKGFLVSATAAPAYDVRNDSTYTSFGARASTYYGFGDGPKNSRRLVLAGLAQIDSIVGADLTDVPADRRFLLGGASSLRGFAFRNVGFTRINGEAVGGLSSISGSAEARIRLTDSFGTALFIDAGSVGETAAFGGLEDLNVGIGAGVRYYTSIGAVRLDVAAPLDEQEGDAPVAFYIGIGQAF